MSLPVNTQDIDCEKVGSELTVTVVPKTTLGQPHQIYPFAVENSILYVPFYYGRKILNLSRPKRQQFQPITVPFELALRTEQLEVRDEAISDLNKHGTTTIACRPGYGKTAMAINLACTIRLKTLIIVNKIILMKQWEDAILKFCPQAKVKRLTSKSPSSDADFYIMNAQNVEKKGLTFFQDVGVLICDEVHLLMAETLSRALQFITPRYMLALSATPYRPDGLDALLELYFGTHKIIRRLYRKHRVYKVETGFTPKMEQTEQGRMNWGAILDQQARSKPRNNLILKIIDEFPERTFLILVKRRTQAERLISALEARNISVTNLIGSKQEFEASAQVLIGTCQKVGTGFDHPKLDTLILAADVQEYFIQYLGRIFRAKEHEPMVFDLVDDNPVLRKHYRTREEVYKKHGGVIMNLLFKETPNLKKDK
jgi:superfamily II DNA or RNA helicase